MQTMFRGLGMGASKCNEDSGTPLPEAAARSMDGRALAKSAARPIIRSLIETCGIELIEDVTSTASSARTTNTRSPFATASFIGTPFKFCSPKTRLVKMLRFIRNVLGVIAASKRGFPCQPALTRKNFSQGFFDARVGAHGADSTRTAAGSLRNPA